MKAALILASAWLCCAQSGQKTEPKTDTWERSKECAERAEKIILRTRMGMKEDSDFYPETWENHYSPKYNRCFLLTHHFKYKKADENPALLIWSKLADAFEQSDVAVSYTEGDFSNCTIGDDKVDCAKVQAFITEHMKN